MKSCKCYLSHYLLVSSLEHFPLPLDVYFTHQKRVDLLNANSALEAWWIRIEWDRKANESKLGQTKILAAYESKYNIFGMMLGRNWVDALTSEAIWGYLFWVRIVLNVENDAQVSAGVESRYFGNGSEPQCWLGVRNISQQNPGAKKDVKCRV